MRILGLDLGSRTCGIAISDPLKMIASAVETYRFADDEYETCLAHVLEVIKANQVSEVVVGLPKHMNGDVGIRGQICIDFKERLEAESGLPVHLVDERLTTAAAERILLNFDLSRKKRKKVIDQMAAVQILQSYLDRRS